MTWYSDVFELIFPQLDREAANNCKVCEWKKQQDDKKKKEKKNKKRDDSDDEDDD